MAKILLIDPSFTEPKNQYIKELFLKCYKYTDQIILINYRHLDHLKFPASFIKHNFSHVILAGTNIIDFSIDIRKENLRKKFTWIKNLKLPCLCICAGHNILGYLYNSEIYHNKEIEKKIVKISLCENYKKYKILNNLRSKIKLGSYHRDSISLPNEFELLGTSKKCKVHIMKHKNKDLYGFQAHPEFTKAGEKILKNFLKL